MSSSLSATSSSSMNALSTSSLSTASATVSTAPTKAWYSLSLNTIAAASSSSISSSLAQKKIEPLNGNNTQGHRPSLTLRETQIKNCQSNVRILTRGLEQAVQDKLLNRMNHVMEKFSSLNDKHLISSLIRQNLYSWILTLTDEQIAVFKTNIEKTHNPDLIRMLLQAIQICQDKAKLPLVKEWNFLDVDLLISFLNDLKPHPQKITLRDPIRPHFERLLERLYEENRYKECLILCEKSPSCFYTGEVWKALGSTENVDDKEFFTFLDQVSKQRKYSLDEFFGCGEKEYFFLRIIKKLTTYINSPRSIYKALSLIASVKGSITIEDHASALCLCAKGFAGLNCMEEALHAFHLVTHWLSQKKSDMLFYRNYKLYYSDAFSVIMESLIQTKRLEDAYQIAMKAPLSTQLQLIKQTLSFFTFRLISLKKFDQAIDVIAKMHRFQSDPHESCYSTDKTQIENLLQKIVSELIETSEGRQLSLRLAKKSSSNSSFKALILFSFVSEIIKDHKIVTEAFGFIQTLSCYDMATANRSLFLYISALIRFNQVKEAVRDMKSFSALISSQNQHKNNVIIACIKEFQRHHHLQAAKEIEKLLQ